MKRFFLAEIFTDHMVIQRNAPVCLYGMASTGTIISASVIGNGIKETADTNAINDKWKLYFPEIPTGGPYSIKISCDSEDPVIIQNVMCGDVWVAGGQSNMEMTLGTMEITEEIKAFPDLENVWIYTVPRRTFESAGDLDEKLESYNAPKTQWIDCKGQQALNFSAIAYYFARKLSQNINVPIGIISCNWGNTSMINWLPKKLLNGMPKHEKVLDDYLVLEKNMDIKDYDLEFIKYLNDIDDYVEYMKKPEAKPEDIPYPMPPFGPKSYLRPSGLFDCMLSKITTFRTLGMLWYQGESDAILDRCDEYKQALMKFYQYLTEDSCNPNMKFLNVQLAPFGGGWVPGDLWPNICQIQLELTKVIPDYALVTIGDLGDDNIHPPRKREVGERLALAAMNKCFGMDVEYCGPLLKSAYQDGSSVIIEFSHATGGLTFKNDNNASFEIAGDDGIFKQADAEIANNSIKVQSVEVNNPKSVRYAWDVNPVIGLYNFSNLPASLFKFDLSAGKYILN